jgi:uroporphyrinogen decarboxylase
MDSRERVLTALEHQEPDRIPYDLGGTAQTGVHVLAYARLREHLGFPRKEVRPRHVFSQSSDLHEDFLDALGADIRHVPRRSTLGECYDRREEGNYWVRTDQWDVVYRMPKESGLYYDVCRSPLDADDIVELLDNYPWPDPQEAWHYEFLRERAQAAHDKGKAVVLQGFTAGILETYAWIRGYNRYFMDLATDHKTAGYLLDRLVEIKAVYWQRALAELDGLVDIVNETDDIAAQQALMISPNTYRKLIKPRHRKLYAAIKKATPCVKLFLHSCGAIRPLIPDFIEIGVDILNPIQLGARGMDPAELKREFGRDLCFWGGGVDAQGVLTSGTPEQVREQVRRNIDALAFDGGFVFAADHVIQADVPPENFIAMWEAFRRYSSYS